MSTPARTSQGNVQGVLMLDYDSNKKPSLEPPITAASAIVDRVVQCALKKGFTLSTGEQELIERWLAAHIYALSDQPYTSRSTEKASGSFQGRTDMGIDATKYGQFAVALDPSGCLNALMRRQSAGFSWLGKPASQQIPIEQRN